jgi:uncharacterized membrane protein (DUF2068 family)
MRKHDPWIRIIGGFKLVKAAVLLVFALSLMNGDLRHELRSLAHAVGVDPEHRLASVLARLRSLDHAHRLEIGAALIVYASLYIVEGVGLLRLKVWAEYLTVVITTSFIPLEVYEMVERGSLLKALVIALNLGAVVYLLWRLRRDHHWPWRLPS